MKETALLTKRFGKINPLSIDEYISVGGYQALKKAIKIGKKQIINEIKLAGLTGRGGAAFPTYFKMNAVKNEMGEKFIICNADEGEPGNFKDRYLLEQDPHQVLEGLIISAYAVGATKGYIYTRGEYTNAITIMNLAIKAATRNGFIGKNILGSNHSFDVELRRGCGSYVCGEESALIASLEGNAGRSRVKPPYPTQKGLFGKPTLINNVETLANLPHIVSMSGTNYSKLGNENAKGTKLISLSGHVKKPGLYEVEYGVTIRDVITVLGRGSKYDRPIKMVQLGGASGPIVPNRLLDMPIDNASFDICKSKIASGAIIVMDETVDVIDVVYRNMLFFEHESCGKCTPCRDGHPHLVRLLRHFLDYKATKHDLETFKSLSEMMIESSICGLGQSSSSSIVTTLEYFPEEFEKRITC